MLCFSLFWLCFSEVAWAGYLTINGTPKIEANVSGQNIILKGSYEIENSGDETAANVFPALTLGAWVWAGEPKSVKAGESETWTLDFTIPMEKLKCSEDRACAGLDLPLSGRFPLYVRRHYEDQNGYRFSAAQVHGLQLGELSSEQLTALRLPTLDGALSCRGDGQSFRCKLDFQNSGLEARKVAAGAFSARELQILDPTATLVEVGANAAGQAAFELRNVSGLLGSSYAVFAVMQWDEGGVRNYASVSGLVSIANRSYGWLFLAGGLGVVLVLAGVIYLKVYRKRG